MKRRTFLGVAGTALTGTAAGSLLLAKAVKADATAQRGSAAERAVLDLERQWMNATVQRDEPTLRSLMADDFKRMEKPWPNIPMFKPQWVGNAIRWNRVELFQYLNISVQVAGKTAVVTSRYRLRGATGEVPINEIVTAEDTWEERNGRWQIVLQFISKSEKVGPRDKPVARRTAIKVDPAIYLAYVGRYRFGPSRILTISHEEGRRTIPGNHVAIFPQRCARSDHVREGQGRTGNPRGSQTHEWSRVHRDANGLIGFVRSIDVQANPSLLKECLILIW
jgi:ketosteroid isomerase-like protein